jgi:hypothetical protein
VSGTESTKRRIIHSACPLDFQSREREIEREREREKVGGGSGERETHIHTMIAEACLVLTFPFRHELPQSCRSKKILPVAIINSYPQITNLRVPRQLTFNFPL